jgi:hypothetical protein
MSDQNSTSNREKKEGLNGRKEEYCQINAAMNERRMSIKHVSM